MRAFVAVPVPEGLQARLAELAARLAGEIGHTSWVARGNYHITLKFLGEVTRARVRRIDEALSLALADWREPVAVMVRGTGAFPTPVRARVLWAGVDDGSGGLAALQRRVDRALLGVGFERERSFSGHITLGRRRRPGPAPEVAAALAAAADWSGGELPIDRVLLMESKLRPGGAEYRRLAGWGPALPGGYEACYTWQ